MKIKTRKSKKFILIATSVAVLLLASASASAYFLTTTKDEQVTAPMTVEDRPVGDINYDTPTPDEENPTIDPPGNTTGQDSLIGVSISYAGGSPLQVRVLIDEVLSTGTCMLSITSGSKEIVSQTAEVFPSSSSTTCKGFTVDNAALTKGTTYTIKVTVESTDKKGTATKEITAQ